MNDETAIYILIATLLSITLWQAPEFGLRLFGLLLIVSSPLVGLFFARNNMTFPVPLLFAALGLIVFGLGAVAARLRHNPQPPPRPVSSDDLVVSKPTEPDLSVNPRRRRYTE